LRYAIVLLAAAALLAAGLVAGGCRGCAKNADLDAIPGMKDSGIPDPHAAKEHEKELQQLNKDIEELSREAAKVAMDPNMSQPEKEKRLAEIEKELEVKSERVKEIAEDITNRDL
jgi:peptidoglycan hydrolase CwlO-like protein